MKIWIAWDDADYYVTEIISVHASEDGAKRAVTEWRVRTNHSSAFGIVSEEEVLP